MKMPISPEGLTVEWLTEALLKQGTLKRGQVTSFQFVVILNFIDKRRNNHVGTEAQH